MNDVHLSFRHWKAALHDDCERAGKLAAFDAIGDAALQLFWERGIEPTMRGLVSWRGVPRDTEH